MGIENIKRHVLSIVLVLLLIFSTYALYDSHEKERLIEHKNAKIEGLAEYHIMVRLFDIRYYGLSALEMLNKRDMKGLGIELKHTEYEIDTFFNNDVPWLSSIMGIDEVNSSADYCEEFLEKAYIITQSDTPSEDDISAIKKGLNAIVNFTKETYPSTIQNVQKNLENMNRECKIALKELKKD